MIAISGAGTPLGKSLLSAIDNKKDILQFDINPNADKGFFIDFFKMEKPSVFINLSCMQNIDDAEYNPENAYNLHSYSVRNSAEVSAEFNCLYLLLSSSYIFNGNNIKPYNEEDSPDPVSVFGDSILLGENYLIKSGSRHLIIRTGDFFGNECGIGSMRFLKKESGNNLKIIRDMKISPSYIPDLAQAILHLVNINASGIFNVCNSEVSTPYDFIVKAAELIRENGSDFFQEFSDTDIKDMRFPGDRPLNISLDIKKYSTETGKGLRSWQEALREYILLNNIKEI